MSPYFIFLIMFMEKFTQTKPIGKRALWEHHAHFQIQFYTAREWTRTQYPTVVAFGYTMIIVVMLLYDVSTDDIDRAPAKL